MTGDIKPMEIDRNTDGDLLISTQALPRKQPFTKTPVWGMFKLAPRRKNLDITGSLHSLQGAGLAGIFIPVQPHMNISEIDAVKGFPAHFAPSLFRSAQNIPKILRHTLR